MSYFNVKSYVITNFYVSCVCNNDTNYLFIIESHHTRGKNIKATIISMQFEFSNFEVLLPFVQFRLINAL